MGVMTMASRTGIRGMVKELGQTMLSMSFNLGGMLAGALLALHLDVFSITPWALLLFPGILSIRGAIGGLFSGRLSTALHLGTVRASYTKNTRHFYVLLHTIITLTLEISVMMGVAASLFGAFLLGTSAADSLTILTVIIATMGISLLPVSPITLGISVLSFKWGLDPDVTVYPVISTVADILVTTCYILVLNCFFYLPLGQYLVWLFDLIFLIIVCYLFVKNYREKEFVKTMKEFLLTFVLVVCIVNITGSTLGKISQTISGKLEIYVVYPAMIDTVGDVGSIVGSTATTKLALGVIRSSFSSIRQHLAEIGSAWSASLIMFTVYAITASNIYGSTASKDISRFIAQMLITNILAVSVIILVSFAVAILTQRRGWDPDNFVIPIGSSLADSLTTISLLMALTMFA